MLYRPEEFTVFWANVKDQRTGLYFKVQIPAANQMDAYQIARAQYGENLDTVCEYPG